MTLRWRSKLRLIGWTAAVVLAAPAAVPASVLEAITEEVQQVFERSSPAVVKVRAISGAAPLAGTGFFIDNQGTLLTSYAVVREAPKAWIEYQNQKLDARVLGTDMRSGVALLKVERTGTPYLSLGNSDEVKMAGGLISVAYPFNLPLAPSFGFVTGFDVRDLNRFFATTHIRSNLAVAPGQIGGPVLNSKGQVVGLLVLAVQEGKESYILPANSVSRVVADIRTDGRARHGWVGVSVVEGQPLQDGPRPIVVTNLSSETPAAGSGIEPGDVVLKIGKRSVQSPRDVLDASFFSAVGEKLPVVVVRNGKTRTFQITVAERKPLVPSAGLPLDPTDSLTLPFVTPGDVGPQRVNAPAP
jgi:serine protease Do